MNIDAIVAKVPKKGAAMEPDGDEYDEDSAAGETSFVNDMMAASKAGDAEAFKSALKGFIEVCYPQLAK